MECDSADGGHILEPYKTGSHPLLEPLCHKISIFVRRPPHQAQSYCTKGEKKKNVWLGSDVSGR